jgi:hypothetical protein
MPYAMCNIHSQKEYVASANTNYKCSKEPDH